MNETIRQISLTSNVAEATIALTVAMCFLITASGFADDKSRRATVKAFVIAVVIAAITFILLEVTWRPFPDRVPPFIYVYGGSAAFAVVSLVIDKYRRLIMAIVSIIAILAGCAGANAYYTQYPTLGSIDPISVSKPMTYEQFTHTTTAPMIKNRPVGAIVTVDFPATASHFVHRPAKVYIPPAYFSNPDVKLPVMVMMTGNPGSPIQWFGTASGAKILDDFQRTHGGVSPIFVSIDGTGTFMDNPLCADGLIGNAMTWLTVDVPKGIKAKFRVADDTHDWTIGGFSYGATCAMQIIAVKPKLFRTFLAFSVQPAPTLGTKQLTIDKVFGGDAAKFARYNPVDVFNKAIAEHSTAYEGIHGRFVAGDLDPDAVRAQEFFHKQTAKLGMVTDTRVVTGRHNYQTWRQALRLTLAFAAQRGGIAPVVKEKGDH